MSNELTLEQRVERIERVLVVQGLLERDMPVVKVVSNPQAVARNVMIAPVPASSNVSALFTYDCTFCGHAHRFDKLIAAGTPRGQFHPVSCSKGIMDVQIEVNK